MLEAREGPEHWRQLREFCAEVVELRRGDHTAQRLQLDRERLADQRRPRDLNVMYPAQSHGAPTEPTQKSFHL